jgi:hexosaminidase
MTQYLLCGLLAVSSSFAAPSVIPQPAEVKVSAGSFELGPDAVIVYADAAAKSPAELLAAQLRPATGFKLPVRPGKEGAVVFRTEENTGLGDEGYILRAGKSVEIKGATSAGLFYGAQTLRQLLPPEVYSSQKVSSPWKIPAVEIRDVPRFGWRGLMLDASRYFMPKADVLKFIDTMSTIKFNTLHWHLTDDQGWRIEIKKYPRLTEVGAWRDSTVIGHARDNRKKLNLDGVRHGGFYTQDDIREIVAYAAERHITIVPEIDMPGHMQAAIAAYPELGCTDEPVAVKQKWGISQIILNPEESTVQFCKDVLSEVMELFPSEFIHIGGDEAKKNQWEKSERIQELLKERGLKDMHEMQSWFIRQMDDFLVANNRRLIGWDEIAEGGLAENAAVMWWRGKARQTHGYEIARNAVRDGHDIVVAANGFLYFDYYQSKDKKNEPLAIGGYLPLETVYNFEPVLEGMSEDEARHILGAQGQLWREYIPTTDHLEYMAFPRACALAELAWLPAGQKDYAGFLERIKTQEKRFDAAGVNYRPTAE